MLLRKLMALRVRVEDAIIERRLRRELPDLDRALVQIEWIGMDYGPRPPDEGRRRGRGYPT